MIHYARTEEQAVAQWKLSNEAEKNYLAAYDWLAAHGYIVIWNEVEQCYEARRRMELGRFEPPAHTWGKVAPRRVELRSIAYKAIALNRCATGPDEKG